ncbi:hypothetical protein MRX96_015955 [Rhipicephalus microplus]
MLETAARAQRTCDDHRRTSAALPRKRRSKAMVSVPARALTKGVRRATKPGWICDSPSPPTEPLSLPVPPSISFVGFLIGSTAISCLFVRLRHHVDFV